MAIPINIEKLISGRVVEGERIEYKKGVIHNRRYRNRRIGDFLKELDMTEGRGTGIPIIRKEMKHNGSPEPIFETDDNYSYFITTLPIHPAFRSDNGASEGINEGVNSFHIADNEVEKIYTLIRDGLNDGLKELINILMNVTGLNATELSNRMNKSIPTIERYLRILKKKDVVEFKGSKKTGGYYFTEKVNKILTK